MTDVADPFAANVDENDPFATAEDVKSAGAFTPRPYLADLAGRLVAFVPRSFEKEAKKPEGRVEAGGKDTEERYTVDMAVLDGGELTFFYKSRVEGTEDSEEKSHTVPADEIPALWENVHRNEGAVIGQLKKVDGTARPILLGRVRRGPQAPDRKKGMTVDQVEAAWKTYEGHLKAGRSNAPKPKFSWMIDVDGLVPADYDVARKWLAAAKAAGFTL